MDKVQLAVLGIVPAPQNSYTIILNEINGTKAIPITIGAFEAQSIALELEGVTPIRPMAHDLIKTLIYSTNINLTEVLLCDFKDGVFFSRLIFEEEGFEIDCRPSDAIAVALRCNSPIYISEYILDEVGLESQLEISASEVVKKSSSGVPPKSKIESLEQRLEKAIHEENYEMAAQIRDEIKKFLESQ